MRVIERVAVLGLLGFMALNAFGAVYYMNLQKRLRDTREPPASAVGSKFPKFSGVDLYDVAWVPSDTPCRVVRVTSDNCVYCTKDKGSYADLVAAALQSSCEIVELAPNAGQMALDPRPGIHQLKFVDTNLAPALFPFATPSTLILDREWNIRWARRGMFDRESLDASVKTIRSISEEGIFR